MKKRIVSLFLVLSLMVPCLTIPTSAVLALPGAAAGATAVIKSAALASLANSVAQNLSTVVDASSEQVQAILDYLVSVTGYGNLGHEGLHSACNRLNQFAANPMKYAKLMHEDAIVAQGAIIPVEFDLFYQIFINILAYHNNLVCGWHIIDHPEYGHVIVNEDETFILADSLGRYPYAQEITDKWLGSRTALDSTTAHIATNYMLNNLQDVHEVLHPDWSFRQISLTLQDGKYLVLQAAQDGIHYDFILCDENGFPYGVSQSSTQAGSDRDYNNDKPDQPEVSDEPVIDIDGDLVMQMFPDGSWTWIDSIIYDASNKTYNIDASTTYNVENNTYFSFEWHYTYHIDYTSITYIGATEEYTKTYEYYFDLPDGRSSADLTAEELLALNVAVDVVPYIRSADDTSIRALYHFDGDCLDDSYWNYLGELVWSNGASITYMDANAFNGSLYLDETVHDFTIKLPSNIYSGDFTMQFRYYQSHTAAPVTDSYIQIGANKLLQMSGSHFYNGSGTALAQTPVGSWNEVCLMRSNNTIYAFLNGVRIGSYLDGTVYGSDIRFYFGTEQQTYKYFDEFRFVSKALYETSGYTPTSVPFDTNLALVLPDSIIPVADEYWSISSSKDNLLSDYGLDYGGQALLDSSYLAVRTTGHDVYSNQDTWPTWAYASDFTSFLADTGSFSMQFHQPPDRSVYSLYSSGASFLPSGVRLYYYTSVPSSGIFTRISTYNAPSDTTFLPSGNYTFSLVFDDGEVVSNTFNVVSYFSDDLISSHGVKFGIQRFSYDEDKYWGYLCVYPETEEYSSGIVYMELVEGTSTDLTAEKVSSIAGMDAKQFKTPTLAVRTDLEITGYQIGGVRPSLPDKGLIWALVEDGRITSLQIYNGQAWEAVDGRIWTGSRWVPYYAYDVLLLKDLYDIVESDPSLDYIYTESGFWKWLQSAWERMMAKLEEIRLAVGGGASPDASTLPGAEDDPTTEEDEGWQFIDLVVIIKDGVWKIVVGVIKTGVNGISGLADGVSNVGGFFDACDADTSGGVLDIMNVGSSAVWD